MLPLNWKRGLMLDLDWEHVDSKSRQSEKPWDRLIDKKVEI